MYTVTLYIHSYLRWAVLLFGLYVVARAIMTMKGNTQENGLPKLVRQFVLLFDLQVVVGVILYAAFSPMVHQAMQNFGHAMKTSALRYWAVEHPTMMLISLVLAHVANVKVKRAADPHARAKTVLIYLGIAMLLLIVMTPWPFGPTHRPLLRF